MGFRLSHHLAAVGGACLIMLATGAAAQAAPFVPFQPLPAQPPMPADNPMSAAKAALGQQLFFDPRLSPDGSVTCNGCHNVMEGGDDGRALSIGAAGAPTRRSAPTLWNVGYYTAYFWDGRATSLEAAIKEHLVDRRIMAIPGATALEKRLAAVPGYQQQFRSVYGGEDAVSYENVTKALAAYLRTLVTTGSPFDRWLHGEETAISETAVRGFNTFVETGCASCHFWVNLAGPVPGLAFQMGEGFYELFPNYPGTAYEERFGLADDIGRFDVTGIETDRRMWRVPTLRNVALTAPYFHNGAVPTLSEAVQVMAVTQLGKELPKDQVADIVVFLNTLTGEFPPQVMPRIPAAPNRSLLASP